MASSFVALTVCEWISVIIKYNVDDYGTGSYPEPPHGWQRRILLMAR